MITPQPHSAEVLQLADGTQVLPDGSIVRPFKKQSTLSPHVALRVPVREMSSLPAPPAVLNAILVVLGYTLLGIRDAEISQATGLSPDRINTVREHDVYAQSRTDIVRRAADGEAEKARSVLAQGALDAASQMIELSQGADSEAVRMAALKDIMDRAGLRPVDIVDHRIKMDGGLTINIIRKDEVSVAPMIDINMETDDG